MKLRVTVNFIPELLMVFPCTKMRANMYIAVKVMKAVFDNLINIY